MQRITFRIWLIVEIALRLGGEGLAWLIYLQGFESGAGVAALVFRIAAGAWEIFALFRWYEVPIVRAIARWVLLTVVTIALLGATESLGWSGLSVAILGAYALAVVFFLGLALIRLALSPGVPMLGVARTLIDEAIRMKVALVFIIGVALLLPVLPLLLDPTDLLKYRIQQFITYSMLVLSVFLSLMTVFLAAATITWELKRQQIFLTLTKPVSRAEYLAGKWLGIMLLNLWLLMVGGTGIYVFTTWLEQEKYELAETDPNRVAIDEQILVARRAIEPDPQLEKTFNELYEERLAELRQREPDAWTVVTPKQQQQLRKELRREWYQLGPLESKSFVFRDLSRAPQQSETLQLRMKPRAGSETPDGRVQLLMRVNGQPYPPDAPLPRMSSDDYHRIDLPTYLIDPQGQLVIDLLNPPLGERRQPTISFNPDDGIQLLYIVGSFESNLVRALLVIWLRLGFLAMAAIMAGTFLSFPIACMLAFVIYFAAAGSDFIAESFTYFAARPPSDLTGWQSLWWYPAALWNQLLGGEILEAIKLLLSLVGRAFLMLVPEFSGANVTAMLADGINVSWALVLRIAVMVGVLWTGVAFFIGWLIFRRRELARVVV